MPNTNFASKKVIVYINTVYGTGSTGKIVAQQYHQAEEHGDIPYVAYGRGLSPDKYNIRGFKIGNKFDFYMHVLSNFFKGNSGFASKHVTHKFLSQLDEINPDIICLHNLHGFYIHVGMLFEYIKEHNIKVVWTLHDCWSFTGQCSHFDYAGCNKWIYSGDPSAIHCHDCPIYRSDYPYSLFKDNSVNNYANKLSAFTGVKDLTIITPSEWLSNLVKQSFLKDYPVKVVHNTINTEIFKPSSSDSIISLYEKYNQYNLANKKILLGVANVWDDRKGLKYMLKLAEDICDEYIVVLIGLNKHQIRSLTHKYKSCCTPKDKATLLLIARTENQKELATWYSASYAYINPTLQDNYPTTNLEAVACGTPVITFRTGGSPETIEEGKSGYIVEKEDYEGMLKCIFSSLNQM